MAWEKRGRGLYYYRKRREGRRVVSEYVGSGPLAALSAELDAAKRQARESEWAEVRAARAEQRQTDVALGTAENALCALISAVLEGYGFHQHKRQWRKRRTMGSDLEAKKRDQVAQRRMGELLDVLAAGEDLEGGELTELERLCRDVPDLWKHVAQANAFAFIEQTSGDAVGWRILMDATYRRVLDGLGYQRARGMERLLIEHAGLCWLRLDAVERSYSQNVRDGASMTTANYWERVLSATQGRFLRALSTLARVRRLALPSAKQVNIGQQQVNVAS